MDFAGIEKFSLVDFEGKVSCTLFFAGCNFHCPFCHNRSLVDNIDKHSLIPFDEIIEFLSQRRQFLDAVVITGGEPTLMNDLKEKIIAIKKLGLLIKLDTNGSNPEVVKQLINENLIDYVAMDIKNSLDKYSLTTDRNINLDNTKKSISLIINSDVDHEFRTTIIKEFHTLEDIKKIAILIKGAKRYRIQKFVASENCINCNLNEIDISTANTFLEEIKKTINDTKLRGY